MRKAISRAARELDGHCRCSIKRRVAQAGHPAIGGDLQHGEIPLWTGHDHLGIADLHI
jgi:hypothetical protein